MTGDPLPDMRDNRSPRELIAAGDHRWPGGHLYLPPHLADRERRLFLRDLLRLEPELPDERDRRRDDFVRAGGGVVCLQCGEKYQDHPADSEGGWCDLTILCDRSRVKL